MDNLKQLFIHNLKAARQRKRLTQAELAERAELSTGFIGDIETGRTSPSFQTIEIIAEILEIEPYMLFLPEEMTKNFSRYQVQTILEEVREVLEKYSGGGEG